MTIQLWVQAQDLLEIALLMLFNGSTTYLIVFWIHWPTKTTRLIDLHL